MSQTTITPSLLDTLRGEIDEALKGIAARHGILAALGKAP